MEKITLKNGNILYIKQEESPMDPREWDNLGTMICFHSRYNLGDHKENKKYRESIELFSYIAGFSPEEIEDEASGIDYGKAVHMVVEEAHKKAIILPLGLYDHSGITMYVGKHAHTFDPGGWDSGQVGWIYVTREKIKKEYGEHGGRTDEEIIEYLEGEVKTYDQYLRGDVYCFRMVKPVTTTWVNKQTGEEVDETTEEQLDSCGGFFGTDWKENGLYDQADIKEEDILEEVTV